MAVDPVCVNNHREYINECQMDIFTCQDGIEINDFTKGHCPPEPCNAKGEIQNSIWNLSKAFYFSFKLYVAHCTVGLNLDPESYFINTCFHSSDINLVINFNF